MNITIVSIQSFPPVAEFKDNNDGRERDPMRTEFVIRDIVCATWNDKRNDKRYINHEYSLEVGGNHP